MTADRQVEKTRFGADIHVTVNYGQATYVEGSTELPRFGFLIESPTFVAYHATRFRGVDYPGGALFTLRSLDGAPISKAESVRVYHGFGSPLVHVLGRVHEVRRERVLRRSE